MCRASVDCVPSTERVCKRLKKNEAGMFEKLVLGAVSAVAALVVVLSMVEIVSVLLS